RSICSRSGRASDFSAILGFVILLLFPEILGQVPKYGCGIRGPSFKRGDAARTAPAVPSLHSNHDVFIEESAVFQEAHSRFRSEFVSAEFAYADQIAQPFGLFRFGQIQERIQTMDFASSGRFSVLSQRF